LDARPTGLVERVRVDVDLDVVLVSDVEARVDVGRRRTPVLVQLETAGTGSDNVLQAVLPRVVALAGEAVVEGDAVRGSPAREKQGSRAVSVPEFRQRGRRRSSHHCLHVVPTGSASSCVRSGSRTCTTADDGRDTRCEGLKVKSKNVVRAHSATR
jgi:hypothetical protein